jgi:ATP-dependent helicase/nuclease subunit A
MSASEPDRRPPTEEQTRALQIVNSSVALSAGAGCGKTFVLAERFVRALDGPNARPLGRIVALTFTNKAARELRERIRKECRARMETGDDPLRWRAVLRGLAAARIGTFHAFCGEVLRQHPIVAGVDPGFAVFDEPIAQAIREESLDFLLRERLTARDPGLLDLAAEYGLAMVRDTLDDFLDNRSTGDIRDWVGREPRELVNHWSELWDREIKPALIADFRSTIEPCLDLINTTTFENDKVRARVDDFREAAARLGSHGNLGSAIESIRSTAMVKGLAAKLWPSPEFFEDVKTRFESIRKESEKLASRLLWDPRATALAASQGLEFARLAVLARKAYDRAKRARGGIDNDDLLWLTRNLLDHHPSVRESLSGSIDLILVDEFQDTDPIQAEILEGLAGSGLLDGKLFLVGDFKQSIYRFRGARPELFQAYRRRFSVDGQLSLSGNFRSIPPILDFVNALFADTFTEEGSALRPGTGPIDLQDTPAVEFVWVPAQTEQEGKQPDVNVRRKDEAGRLARHLRIRLDEGWIVRDEKTKEPRRATQGDVAILFRSLSDASYYEQALVAEGLDYHVVGGSGFFAQQEVLDLINVLTAVEDPLDAVSLAGALRSPFFSLSDDALYWISTQRIGMPHEGLERCAGPLLDTLPEADRPRADRARRLLESWRAVKDRLPIAALVDRILTESGYEAALIGEFLGDRKRANARKLVRMARRFDEQGGFTLADFVARLRADLRSATKETQAATTDEQGEIIRLMSIHQAKGLEFPIVVLPDLDRERPRNSQRAAFDPDLGPLVNAVVDADDGAEPDSGGCLGWMIYRFREQEADNEEALRLFYVATTRARDALVLSSASDPSKRPSSPAFALLDRRFDRETGQFKGQLPEGWAEPGVLVVPESRPSSAARQTNRSRPRLRDVARIINEASERPTVLETPATSHPRFVRLDPAFGLSSTSARLDRLIRTILADPRSFEAARIGSIAARCALLQDPVSPRALVAEAKDRISILARMPLAREINRSASVHRSFAWTIVWPPEGQSTVFEGRGDLIYRRADGEPCLVTISDPRASEPLERLRLLLSALAAEGLEMGPIRQAWWVRLGRKAELVGFDRFDDREIDRAVSEVFAGQQCRD